MEAAVTDKKNDAEFIENLSEFQKAFLLLVLLARDGVDIVKEFGSPKPVKNER